MQYNYLYIFKHIKTIKYTIFIKFIVIKIYLKCYLCICDEMEKIVFVIIECIQIFIYTHKIKINSRCKIIFK